MDKRVRIGLDWLLDVLVGRELAELPLTRSTSA